MTYPQGPVAATAGTLKVLALALAAAPLVITVAVLFVLGAPTGGPDAIALGCLGLVVLGAVVAETIGFVVPALPPGGGEDPQVRANQSVAAFQAAGVRRFVAVEASFIVALAVAFAFTEDSWPVVLTVVPVSALVLLELWPSRRNADRLAARLEREGAPSHLHAGLGLA